MKSDVLKKAFNACLTMGNKVPVFFAVKSGKFTIATATVSGLMVVQGESDFPDFTVSIPIEHISQLVKSFKKQDVELLEVNTTSITFRQGKTKSTFTVNIENSLDVTAAERLFSDDYFVEMDAEELHKFVPKLSGMSGVKAQLAGLHFTAKSKMVELMATNNFVIAVAQLNVNSTSNSSTVTYVLPKVFYSVERILEGSVKFSVKESKLTVLSESSEGITYKFLIPLVDASPLPYTTVIENFRKSDNLATFTVNSTDLRDTLKASAYFTDDSLHNKINMSFRDDILEFTSSDDTKGEVEAQVSTFNMKGSGKLVISADLLSRGAAIISDDAKMSLNENFILVEDDRIMVLIATIKK